jgi:hypothetical protein
MLAKEPADRPTTGEIIELLQEHVQVGGPDVRGLEEESWTVDEIIEDADDDEEEDDAGTSVQFLYPGIDTDEDEDELAPATAGGSSIPIGLLAAIFVGFAIIAGLGFVMISGDDADADESAPPDQMAAATTAPKADEPEPPEESEEEVAEMVIGLTNGPPAEETPDISGQIDAARSGIGGGIADASTASTEAAEELENERRKKRRRRKKKKKKKLREIRLDL